MAQAVSIGNWLDYLLGLAYLLGPEHTRGICSYYASPYDNYEITFKNNDGMILEETKIDCEEMVSTNHTEYT